MNNLVTGLTSGQPVVAGATTSKVGIWFYVVKSYKNFPQGFNPEMVVNQLNGYYSGLFEFKVCGMVEIDDPKYYLLDLSDPIEKAGIENWANQFPEAQNAIKVFVTVFSIGSSSYPLGLASAPISGVGYPAVYIATPSDPILLAHELGHYFGLSHTHQGFVSNHSLANDEDCMNNGDGICDTPTDPQCDYNNTSCTLNCGNDPFQSMENYYFKNEGKEASSPNGMYNALWFSEDTTTLPLNDQIIAEFEIEALEDIGDLTHDFVISSDYIPTLFYDKDGKVIEDVQLYLSEINDSSIIERGRKQQNQKLYVFPVIVDNVVRFSFENQNNQLAQIRITDGLGREVTSHIEMLTQPYQEVRIDNLDSCIPGLYFYQVQCGSERKVGKLIKQ